MNIEEFKNINLGRGKPNPTMTDSQWQEYFKVMKFSIKPSAHKRMPTSASPMIVNHYAADYQFAYRGETQWSTYKSYINSVLSAIRRGEHDYCYYIYQIADLLKYEHDALRTRWLPDYCCFQVWLDSGSQIKQNK